MAKLFGIKGGFKSEDTEKFLCLQHKYSKSLSLFTVLGGEFKFSAQDSDLEYLCWRHKNFQVSSDLQPPLARLSKVKVIHILLQEL